MRPFLIAHIFEMPKPICANQLNIGKISLVIYFLLLFIFGQSQK